jgi:predicted  nucleic acid-binding Zn-ribbon protein
MSRQEERRVLLTAEAETRRLEEQRAEIEETLCDLRDDIRAIQARLRSGTVDRKTEAAKPLSELKYWLKAIRETEAEIDAIRRRELAIAGPYGLDLEAARDEIGCRLARLRPCCGAGEGPE